MDKVILSHLEKQDELLDDVQSDIDKAYGGLDLHEILQSPRDILEAWAQSVASELVNNHGSKFVDNGINFVKSIEAKKTDVKVQPRDPDINKNLEDRVKG